MDFDLRWLYWLNTGRITAYTKEFNYEVMTVMTEKKLLVYVCSGELEIGNGSIANIFYIYTSIRTE